MVPSLTGDIRRYRAHRIPYEWKFSLLAEGISCGHQRQVTCPACRSRLDP